MSYEETDEFKRDFKKLQKKFRTLKDDLQTVKKAVIELRHIHQIDNLSAFEIQGFGQNGLTVWKIKKFACKALKGRGVKSGIRVIYAFEESLAKVTLLEIYYKGDKENEDRDRIHRFCNK